MNPIKKLKAQGIPLKTAIILMILTTVVIMGLLLFFTFQSADLYSRLSETTEQYIQLQKSAESLMDASDYLTDKVQRFTVMNEREDMDSYFDEANNVRRREKAVEILSQYDGDSTAAGHLKTALGYSIELMNTEMKAMKLICEVTGIEPDYEGVRSAVLPEECAGMTDDEKLHFAQMLVHDSVYYDQKMSIKHGMVSCIDMLVEDMHDIQVQINGTLRTNLIVMRVLLVVHSIAMVVVFLMTFYLGINPILKGVQRIKENRKIPVMGSYEFRYLAKTYNKMYEQVQKNIEHLSYDASHDKLTGLYNRAGYDLLSESIDLPSTAVLIIDADRFKEINDTHGHAAGDEILKKIADALRYAFRREDYICRIGGDEFVVFMLHMDEKRRELINIKIKYINDILADTSDGLPAVSISVGAAFGCSEDDLKTTLKHADDALYKMKAEGRHGCSFYIPKSQVQERTEE